MSISITCTTAARRAIIIAHRVRALDEVSKCGAWRAFASVVRHAKPGRVNEEFAGLPEAVKVEVIRRSDRFEGRLLHWRWSGRRCSRERLVRAGSRRSCGFQWRWAGAGAVWGAGGAVFR